MVRVLSYILICFFIANVSFAALKDDLFDDYKIYSKDVEKVINQAQKNVFKNIDDIKSLLLYNEKSTAYEKLNNIHAEICNLDAYIKAHINVFKTKNMKDALTYPYMELSFYEKVAGEIVAFYNAKGSITKKEIKNIEKQYKEEEKAIKKKAADIRNEFLSAVF